MLVDISYILNIATRIAAGDVPYAQFPLAQAPLTFLTQAVLIKLFGPPASKHGNCIRYRIVKQPKQQWEFCFKGQKMTSAAAVPG